eukprot:s568_g16.t1
MTLAISDLGEIDCASALWLQRLRREECLPEKGLLETLRRREKDGREQAEAAVASERSRADLAVECLARERSAHHQREKLLKEAQAALKEEQQRRAEAEASAASERKARCAAEEARSEETRQKIAAEARLAKSKSKVQELTRVLEDDESLRVLDDFRQKLDSQRREISSLRQQLSAAKDEATAKVALVERGRLELSEGQEKLAAQWRAVEWPGFGWDRLANGSAPTAIQEVTGTLFSPEGRAQRLVTKLLWRTAFLKRCTEVLGSHRGSPEMSLKLLELVARMFAEELLGSASISCGVARPNHKGDVDGMLLDALVAHIDHQCRSEAPGVLLLFQLLEHILEACGAAPDVREALCRRIQSSNAIVSTLVSSMTLETDMDISEESGALLLRLLERGGHEFLAPLAQNSGRSSAAAETLLSWHSQHAVGLSRHLASGEGALMAAAAELVEDLGAIFRGEDVQVEGWLRKAQLAQWLIECLRRGDLSARCAACGALKQLPLDDQLRPLHAVAADALMEPLWELKVDACGDALSLASSGAERQQLLQAAADTLERLNAEETCGLFAPQKLIPLLRAAKDLSQEGRGCTIMIDSSVQLTCNDG